jgi:hypothetical protein
MAHFTVAFVVGLTVSVRDRRVLSPMSHFCVKDEVIVLGRMTGVTRRKLDNLFYTSLAWTSARLSGAELLNSATGFVALFVYMSCTLCPSGLIDY